MVAERSAPKTMGDFLPTRGEGPPRSLAEIRRERMAFNPHPNLKDKAATYLRDEILTGGLKAGEKIDQEEIADRLGMSRLPVREALIELAQENLVDWIPRRGSFVAEFTQDDIVDLYAIQGAVAGIAGRRAAAKVTDEEIAILEEIHAEYVKADDRIAQADIGFAFHQVILDAGASNRVLSVLRLLYRSLPIDFLEATPTWKTTTLHHQAQIIAAMKAHDGDAAANAFADLFADSARLTLDLLRARGLWSN